MHSQFNLLDIANTAWAVASSSFVNEPLMEAIAAQAITLIRDSNSSQGGYLGNPLALGWALWRLRKSDLEVEVFRSLQEHGILVELVASGIALMGNEWRRLDPVEVHLE